MIEVPCISNSQLEEGGIRRGEMEGGLVAGGAVVEGVEAVAVVVGDEGEERGEGKGETMLALGVYVTRIVKSEWRLRD